MRCQRIALLSREPEKEVFREALPVAFDRFVQAERLDAIKLRQVRVEHYPHTTDNADEGRDTLDRGDVRLVVHAA